MAKCEKCGKGPVSGNNVSHAQNRTKRIFAPNIQKTQVLENGRLVSKRWCTRCIRSQYKRA